MSKIDDFNEEMEELHNKLDQTLDALTNGKIKNSEANKISREVGKRISEIANKIKELNSNK